MSAGNMIQQKPIKTSDSKERRKKCKFTQIHLGHNQMAAKILGEEGYTL